MSPQNSAAQGLASETVEQKQRSNIYTMMLILSFIFIVIACVLLYMELQLYGEYPWWKTGGIAPPTTSHAPQLIEPGIASTAIRC